MPKPPKYTTLAVGEEDPIYTTLAVGEEDPTTEAVGEEDGGATASTADSPFGAF